MISMIMSDLLRANIPLIGGVYMTGNLKPSES